MDAPRSTESGVRAGSAARDATLEPVLAALHPRLRTGSVVFLLGVGRQADAVWAAFAVVADEVRHLARSSVRNALDLVATAFAPQSGPLADPDAPPHRQRAMQRLFVDAFVRHGTPLARCEADQALEGLLLADLLMRELEAARTRLHRTSRSPTIPGHPHAPGGG